MMTKLIKKGAIAIRRDTKVLHYGEPEIVESVWKGVFHAQDSTPTVFGPVLWEILQDNWKCLNRFAKQLLDCAYWEEYMNDGLCPYCGKYGVGAPNSVRADILVAYNDGELAPDPDCKRHNHVPPIPTVASYNAKNDGLWLEWVYVINPDTYSLEVLKSVRTEGFNNSYQLSSIWKMSNYRYALVGLFSLLQEEPDWEFVEAKGLTLAGRMFRKYHLQGNK